jgi:hypothetical protein
LKLNKHNTVVVAHHGLNKALSKEDISKNYSSATIELAGGGFNPTKRFWVLTTYFEASISFIFGLLVDLYDNNTFLKGNYVKNL